MCREEPQSCQPLLSRLRRHAVLIVVEDLGVHANGCCYPWNTDRKVLNQLESAFIDIPFLIRKQGHQADIELPKLFYFTFRLPRFVNHMHTRQIDLAESRNIRHDNSKLIDELVYPDCRTPMISQGSQNDGLDNCVIVTCEK